jgi:hypothetical protein
LKGIIQVRLNLDIPFLVGESVQSR